MMRVFLSYRRSDNDYLAAAVHDGLVACSASVSVFFDVESIDLMVTVEEAWREHAASPSPALVEICRIGAVALTRLRDSGTVRPATSGALDR